VKEMERVLRVLTHANIGAALGIAAWVLWSSCQGEAAEANQLERDSSPSTHDVGRTQCTRAAEPATHVDQREPR